MSRRRRASGFELPGILQKLEVRRFCSEHLKYAGNFVHELDTMNLFKPTYRLSWLQFFLFTLAYYLFVAVVGLIISETGGSGGWIGLLVGLALFLLYLRYIVDPRLQGSPPRAWAILIPVGRKGVPKIVNIAAGLLAVPIILGGGLVTAAIFGAVVSTCFAGAWGCSNRNDAPLAAESAMIQTAMDAMMVDNNLVTVSANDNTTGSLGVNTWTALPEGPGALPLASLYLRDGMTNFYYCWDNKGYVYAQNTKDGAKAQPDDAEKQRPCKEPPDYQN